MTDVNWLKLSGMFRKCLYNSESSECPFNAYRNLDHIQQMQIISTLSETDGAEMLAKCKSCRKSCSVIPAKVVEIQNSNNFKIVG